jgi:lipopolysaccharide export LptBFGC system permease protein LptF
MRILDRAIIGRFLVNFAILFTLLYALAASIDVILQMKEFVSATAAEVKAGRHSNSVFAFVSLVVEFHGPRLFQFFQFMVGLVGIGAMGFTFAQMHRARELTAIMAAGVPLRRCVWAVLFAALVLNLFEVANQELILPRLAERLMRDHGDLGKPDGAAFAVPLTRDSAGNLLYASKFDPESGRITGFLGLERDDRGSLVRRVTANAATWDAARSAWLLESGTARRRDPAVREGSTVQEPPAPAEAWPTDLSPRALTARNYRLFAQVLSSPELGRLADAGAIERSQADRMVYGRFGTVIVNLLVLVVAVPFFLQRGPANMLRETVLCAATCVPAIILSAVLMAAPVPGLPPAVSVALPVAVLAPIAVARMSWLRS